jgi:hypothetical protein
MKDLNAGSKMNSRFQKEKKWFMERKTKTRIGFIFLGVISTIWFLIRVIPKPSRINYPCMRIAAPFASGFILYIAGITTSVFAVKKIRTSFKNSHYLMGTGFILLLLFALLFSMYHGTIPVSATTILRKCGPNQPIGIARGIFPGRVVWVWDPEATNENCTDSIGDYWWQNENTSQVETEKMLSDAIRTLTGKINDTLAWDAIFRYYNQTHGHGDTGYTTGQKIMIKLNITTGYLANVDTSTYQKDSLNEAMDVAPQLALAMLKQLINVAGVAQEDISMGDPDRLFFDHFWDICHSVFPSVKYLDRFGKHGRTRATPTSAPVLFYSDGTISDSLPQAYVDASYMINIACLKQHNCAGGTFCAKNHFGSVCREWSTHLHYSLPSPDGSGNGNGYGKYRCLVDLMEHKDLGEKTVLFMLDGLWGGDEPVCSPKKWQMVPFNNEWPSSLFVSQDHVAIESVGFNFIRAQFTTYAHMDGGDDYLYQAADSTNWAPGIVYNPNHDGTRIASMGTFEQWNNDTDKQYSRNLGTGNGIELIQRLFTGITDHNGDQFRSQMVICYPNPVRSSATVKILGLKWNNINKKVIVFNSGMKEVRNIDWMKNQKDLTFHRENLDCGVYYLMVESPDKVVIGTSKIVISD